MDRNSLAPSVGQPQIHLGMHMAATALPDDPQAGGPPEEVLIWFGIIDILQVCCHRAHALCQEVVQRSFSVWSEEGQRPPCVVFESAEASFCFRAILRERVKPLS